MLAITNDGVLITSRDNTVMTRSDSRYWRIAPQAPTTTPITAPDIRADDEQPQGHPDPSPQLVGHRLSGHRGAEVAADRTGGPVRIAQRNGLVEAEFSGFGVDHRTAGAVDCAARGCRGV